MPKKVEIEFDCDFERDAVIAKPIGRFVVGDRHVVRMVFTPRGVVELYCSPGARKHIHFMDTPKDLLGFKND